MADQNTFDAIVIGSGITGGWAAKELTEKGLRVIMLERGRNIEHIKDYVTATLNPWEFKFRGRRPTQSVAEMKEVKEAMAKETKLFRVSSRMPDSPYTQVKSFLWNRSYNVGGKSLSWGRQSYRFSDFDFEANAKDGWAVDWPIRYKDIAPWYDYVEKFAGISGNKDGLMQLPDGQFMPPMEMNCVEIDMAAKIKSHYKGQRAMIIGRTANITQPLEGRTDCQYRDKCSSGCPFGSYFSTQSSTLPAAMKTGRLTLRPFSIVTKIIYDKNRKKATGVEIIDAETNKTYVYKSKIVFVCASTINSTSVLMNSATDIWPDGLGSSSGELGHNLMDHHLGIGVGGTAEGYDDKYFYGRRSNGIYIPRYRNLFGEKRDYIRGFGFQGNGTREGSWNRNIAEYSIGETLMELLTEPGRWSFGMGAFGEMLPYHDNKISFDTGVKDKWGMNTLAIDCEIKENEKSMRKDMLQDSIEFLEICGLKKVGGSDRGAIPGNGIHETGTARMGRDPKTSVLNAHNQLWDAKNVFVTDGASFTSSPCQNPSLTFMALTARAASFAASELKKQNI
ncbi:MAG: GMC family oxidoreductase [Ginsengibacter sp.]